MTDNKINEDYLLLLINKNGLINIDTITIDKNFEKEHSTLNELFKINEYDNIDEIISFINSSLKPKLPNKIFNYCKELDRAYQGVKINIEKITKEILDKKQLIYLNKKIASEKNAEFNLLEELTDLKEEIREEFELWFKAFDIELTYEKAKKIPNILVFSHRISGWSNPEYRITKNMTQQVKTNFGYGRSSYFYSLITYKNIQIIPLSEWVDYRYARFSQVIRYTKSFKERIPIKQKWKPVYFVIEIKNEFWRKAMEFTQTLANISLKNENEFIEKYIINECEQMVEGLENIYKNKIELLSENQIFDKENEKRYSLDIKGFELIDFKTEKIIGALSFIDKLMEYDTIISTKQFIPRIKKLSKKFIPNVYPALKNEEQELKKANEELQLILNEYNEIREKFKFYHRIRDLSEATFNSKYSEQYKELEEKYDKIQENLNYYNDKVEMHERHIFRLNKFIGIYNQFMNK